MTDGTKLLADALHFAAERHTVQRRKGDRAEPYVNHLVEVLHLVAHGEGGDDAILLAAAVLHDTVEDTDTTPDEITARFGAEVAAVVAEVTDDKTKEKQERKRLQVETVASKSVRAKRIKLADKTSNLRALVASPPVDWDLQRKRDYVAWAAAVVAGCRGVDVALEAAFDEAYADGLRAFGAPSAIARVRTTSGLRT